MCLILSMVFFVSLWSCSASSRRQGWTKGLDSQETNPKQVKNFFSSLRSPGGNPESHYLLACYYQERGEHREALEEFKKAVLIDPGHAKAHSGMGISYDQLKDFVRAVECYERALALNPDLDGVHNNLGYSYLLQGRTDEAISAFKRAISRNGRDPQYHNNLGLAYATQGRLDLALDEFKLAGDESNAHYNVARFYQERGLHQLAHYHFSMALTLDPSFTHARLALKAMDALARIFKADLPADNKEDRPSDIPSAKENESVTEEPLIVSDLSVVPVVSDPPHQAAEVELKPVPEAKSGVPEAIPPEMATAEAEGVCLQEESAPRESAPERSPSPVPRASQEKEPEAPLSRPQPDVTKASSSPLRGINVEVSNGNGVNGMARRVGRYLQAKGLEVTRVTNASHFNHRDSKIYYQRGYQEAATHLAEQLPSIQDVEETRPSDRPQVNVKVLIGKDLVQHQKLFAQEK